MNDSVDDHDDKTDALEEDLEDTAVAKAGMSTAVLTLSAVILVVASYMLYSAIQA